MITHLYKMRSFLTKIGTTSCGIRTVIFNPYSKHPNHNDGTSRKDMWGTGSIKKANCIPCLKAVIKEKELEVEKIDKQLLELTNLNKD